MNPKAITTDEMFGETDRISGEWNKGVFGAIWEKFNRRNLAFNMWIVCDGPVDALWIENLNTGERRCVCSVGVIRFQLMRDVRTKSRTCAVVMCRPISHDRQRQADV